MQKSSIAAALAAAVLDEAADPKRFLMRQRWAADSHKRVGDYSLENIGIDHGQYFRGRGTSYTKWDAVYVGTGDNPAESINDALEAAAMDGWNVEGINVDDWPDTPSVAEECERQAALERGDEEDEEGEADFSMEDCELYYYTAVWLKEYRPTAESLLLGEAIDPKRILSRLPRFPKSWPSDFEEKWTRRRKRWNQGWDYMRRAYVLRQSHWGDEPRQPYRFHLNRTYFHHDPQEKTYSVRLHDTHILNWDQSGNVTIDPGGWWTNLTRDRMNEYLPHGWRVMSFRGNWYWYNTDWPQNIMDRLYADMRSRRGTGTFPWWIEVDKGDRILSNGTLEFGKRGAATPDGHLKLGTQLWPNLRPPPVGQLAPLRRHNRRRYDPNQMQFQLEGKYLDKLAWIKRARKKNQTMKDLEHARRELEDIDKPDKKRKKRMNLH